MERRRKLVAEDQFALISEELQTAIVSAGYTSVERRLDLFDLDADDVNDMGLNLFLRKELEKFLGLAKGALKRCPSASISAPSTMSPPDADATEDEADDCSVSAGSSYFTPCGGRGGVNIADFPTESNRAKGWTRRAATMDSFVTLYMIACAELVEPRLRECIDDIKQLQHLHGGKALAVLLVELVVFCNIAQPGAEWSLTANDIDGIVACTFQKLFKRQTEMKWPEKIRGRVKAITRRKPYPGIVPNADTVPG